MLQLNNAQVENCRKQILIQKQKSPTSKKFETARKKSFYLWRSMNPHNNGFEAKFMIINLKRIVICLKHKSPSVQLNR